MNKQEIINELRGDLKTLTNGWNTAMADDGMDLARIRFLKLVLQLRALGENTVILYPDGSLMNIPERAILFTKLAFAEELGLDSHAVAEILLKLPIVKFAGSGSSGQLFWEAWEEGQMQLWLHLL